MDVKHSAIQEKKADDREMAQLRNVALRFGASQSKKGTGCF
jgi:hypothetical protein